MRGMGKTLASTVFLIGPMLGWTTSVWAAAGVVVTKVEPLSPTVTYSRPANPPKVSALTTYIGFSIDVRNSAGNTINGVVFEGTIEVKDPQEIASYFPTADSNCEQIPASGPGNTVSISCQVGQLKAFESKPFIVFFVAPLQDTASPLPLGQDFAGFSGRVITAEGADVGNSPNDSVDPWPLEGDPYVFDCGPAGMTYKCIRVDLGTPNPLQVKSAIPKTGGTFFTGEGGIPGLIIDDVYTTTVTVPDTTSTGSGFVTKATVNEPTVTGCTSFVNCFASDISVTDAEGNVATFTSAAYLKFLVRIDGSNIVKGTKIGAVTIQYTDDTNQTHPVGLCEAPTVPRSDGVPCIADQKTYKTKRDPFIGFEFGLISLKNGRLTLF